MAAPSIRFDLTPESQARFRRVLHDLQAIARKRSGPLVKAMANMFAVSARADTPKGKAFHAIKRGMTSEDRKTARAAGSIVLPGATIGHEYWTRGVSGKPYWVIVDQAKRRRVKHAGAARAAWSGAIRKIGDKTVDAGAGSIPAALQSLAVTGSRVTAGDSGRDNRWLAIDYIVKYLAKLRPNIMATSMVKMQNRFANSKLKQIGEEFRQRWAAG